VRYGHAAVKGDRFGDAAGCIGSGGEFRGSFVVCRAGAGAGMDDYGSLVYLDVQKTGSTFVREFLAQCCTLPQVGFARHAPVAERRPESTYFTTVRHPLAQYTSLYRFGMTGKGGVFGRLNRAGRADLYAEGFSAWLSFLLEESNARFLDREYAAVAGSGIGFMTFRFATLAVPDGRNRMPALVRTGTLASTYEAEALATDVIRTEGLNDGLRALVSTYPGWFNQRKTQAFLASPPEVNVSRSPMPEPLTPDLVDEILRREAFIIDRFYC
jgi:hypothetical protein